MSEMSANQRVEISNADQVIALLGVYAAQAGSYTTLLWQGPDDLGYQHRDRRWRGREREAHGIRRLSRTARCREIRSRRQVTSVSRKSCAVIRAG
jgi:hypothetical protein